MRYIFLLLSFISLSQKRNVDFLTLDAVITPNFKEKSVSGILEYTFQINKLVDTIAIDAKNIDLYSIAINGKTTTSFLTTKTHIKIFDSFKKGKNKLSLSYKAIPKQALYFIGTEDQHQIWTQGQGKYTSHWLPSFDDTSEKVIFNITVCYDKNYTAIANGKLVNQFLKDNQYVWQHKMQLPMSSYLVMIAIGHFIKKEVNLSNKTLLQFFLDKKDSLYFENTYAYSEKMFSILEKYTGMPYPWQIYKQVPVKDFLYAGMENTTATIFSQDFVVDEIGFFDKCYVNVNAHELAHQWFGNVITAKNPEDHWLQEGFATYFALLVEKNLFGEDYFNWELYEMAERIEQASNQDKEPILSSKASSLTYYQKGAWALHYLSTTIGEKAFFLAVKNYLKKYAYQVVTTQDFLNEISKVSSFNVAQLKKDWLENPAFNQNQALDILNKSTFITTYLNVVSSQELPFKDKSQRYLSLLAENVFYPIKQEIIYQLASINWEEKESLLNFAFTIKDLKVRQALAQTIEKIPLSCKTQYESLLDDASYITQEIALRNLWESFPENREDYLNKMQKSFGLQDYNLRILWLTLALKTTTYKTEKKILFYDELLNYATPIYETGIRQNALNSLLYLNPNDTNIFLPLIQATTHFKWQFSLFARNQIRNLLKTERHKKYFTSILPTLSEKEKTQLERLLSN